jgi:hypothetical protein
MAVHATAASQPRDGAIVAKAVIRAAERLGIPGRVLAAIIGVSEATGIVTPLSFPSFSSGFTAPWTPSSEGTQRPQPPG